MRVYVCSAGGAISPQILAYAEYRIFAVLARYGDVRGARVVLYDEAAGSVRCAVTIEFDGTSMSASAKGVHAVATIDRAAARIAEVMGAKCLPDTATASR